VAWADEIWVVDSASTDGSGQIVEQFANAETRKAESGNSEVGGRRSEDDKINAETLKTENGNELKGQVSGLSPQPSTVSGPDVKLVQFQFNGTWPKKKNWALENLPFKHEWVFILDADEVLLPEAEAEIRDIIAGGQKSEVRSQKSEVSGQKSEVGSLTADLRSPTSGQPVGYWINRRFMFMGKWLKHAYYPNWNLRLFKHRLGRYEKLTDVDTASGDNEVHEHVVVKGRTGRLRCEMDHYAFPSVDVFMEKHNRYSNWEARVALDRHLKGSSQSLQSKEVGKLRRLKLLSQRLPFRPLQRFLYVYLWQRGFLDGRPGWHFARLHAVYEYLCVVKTIELKKQKKDH
jgi:glycosyltransferase involved in cell wall biosynthesis